MAGVDVGWHETTELIGVLIYDGKCPFCSAAATALRRVPDVGVVSWHEPEAQNFLEAMFDEPPFALFLIDASEESVYAGRDAAGELCHRAGLPMLVGDLVGENYERLAGAIQTTVGGRKPDPYHDTFPLTIEDRDALDRLFEAAEPSEIIVEREPE